MKLSFETKALGWALLAVAISLCSTWLLAKSISANQIPSLKLYSEIATSPELVERGKKLYQMSCSHCHGDDAEGDEGPNLHHLSISNARIASTIKNGIKGEMPSFSKKYDANQITALVAYLSSLK